MREYAKKSESQSRTLDNSTKAFRQVPINVILQQYKERNIQRYASAEEDEQLQGKFHITQRNRIGEDELLQGKFEVVSIGEEPIKREEKLNNTGLPDNLKTGIENLSGFSMDDVKVHYNSDKPAQLNALAYAQGTDIYVAPGQEQHLAHEAWHVVQQKQGRVQPTLQLKGVNVNDDEGLEKEADSMRVNSVNVDQSIVLKKAYVDMTNKSDTCQFALNPIKWALFTGFSLFTNPQKAVWAANNGNNWQHATQLYHILVQFNLDTNNLNWTPGSLINLNLLFNANAGVCNAQEWGQIAIAHANLVDQENDVAEFARIAGWIPANLVNLANLFGADHGVCNAQEWGQIAIAHANLINQENDVAGFARIAGWTPANLVNFASLFGADQGVCNAQEWGQIAIAHANLINQEAGVAELARMAGWAPANIPNFALNALNTGLSLINLQAFLGTPNAVASCLAVVGWGANVLGATIGIVLTVAGAPTNAETVQLLGLSNAYVWPALNLQSAANAAGCGAPVWANSILHTPTFAVNWAGAAGGGMGGTIVVDRNFAGLYFGGGYNVNLRLTQGRINHVWDGHSFEHFNMTYANCIRNNVGGNITFYPLGTLINNILLAHANSHAGKNLADQVAADYPIGGADPHSFRQNNMGGDRVGIASNGNRIAPPSVGGTYPTHLTQCYPLAGIQIVGRDLVAIGRLIGQIP